MATESSDALSPALQVAGHIRVRIMQGTLRPGERLPSSRDLARELGVAKGTILSAYTALRESGAVHAVWNGFVVADAGDVAKADENALTREVQMFIARLKRQGFKPEKIREEVQRSLDNLV